MSLTSLGWTPERQQQLDRLNDPDLRPARVVRQDARRLSLHFDDGDDDARASSRLRQQPPAVGDWVVARRAFDGWVVEMILERRTKFSRSASGREAKEQVVAANVDVVLLVAGLDGDLNLRRLERYLALAHESGAEPVVVLNKADLCDDVDAKLAEVREVARGIDVVAVSAGTGVGLDPLKARLRPGVTAALLGSSGVGKSTLVNALLGREAMPTGDLRADGRGRHTTTHRELLPLPGGACLLDTPGMREVHLWGGEEGVRATFDDVEALVVRCRFSDCEHRTEPGCAVRAALDVGELDRARWASYEKLRREAAVQAARAEARTWRAQTRSWGRRGRDAMAGKEARRREW